LIDGELVLVLDMFQIMVAFDPSWYDAQKKVQLRLLLVEDSKFFASMLVPPLKSEGVEVVHVHNGQEALAVLENQSFDLVVSDIEMPVMGGFEFARKVREKPDHDRLALVGMSSMTDPTVESKALAAGFDQFMSKMDNSVLVEGILERIPGRESD
jgi:two-component system chemotaxis sensor kinase CheA